MPYAPAAGDQLWFVAASAGDENSGELNVQWFTEKWPVTTTPASVSAASHVVLSGETNVSTATWHECYGKWTWTSHQADGVIDIGNQLEVGTVFGAKLPFGGNFDTWSLMDVWIKFKTANLDRFDGFYVAANDTTVPANKTRTGNYKGSMSNDTWKIGELSSVNISGWERSNLRAYLVVLGTTDYTKVGATDVEVEWICIRLRTETVVSP